MKLWDYHQVATIRLPNCPGQSLDSHDFQKNCSTGKNKWKENLQPPYHSSYKHQKSYYKPSIYANFLTLHILFCYVGTFGQAVLWPSFPNWVMKKEEIVSAWLSPLKGKVPIFYVKMSCVIWSIHHAPLNLV